MILSHAGARINPVLSVVHHVPGEVDVVRESAPPAAPPAAPPPDGPPGSPPVTGAVSPPSRPPRPAPGPLHPDRVPIDLRTLPRWVPWAWRWSDRRQEWAKVPLRLGRCGQHGWTEPGQLQAGDSTDPAIWQHLGTIIDYIECGYPGTDTRPGIALGDGCGLVGIDLDGCRDPLTGGVEPWAMDIVTRMASYTEVSPSGRGLRIWVRGRKTHPRCRVGQIEVYDRVRYLTVTGDHLDGTPTEIQDRQTEIDTLCLDVFGPPSAASQPRAGGAPSGSVLAALLNEAKNALWPGPGRGRRIAESNEPLAGNSGKMRDQALKSVPRTWYED